jgi:hypothetical protein
MPILATDPTTDATRGVVLVLLALAAYMLPTIVAGSRHHPNTAPVLVLNLLLGWTLVGWAVALAWALTAIERRH